MSVTKHPVKTRWILLASLLALGLAPRVEAGGRGPRPGTNTSKKPKSKYPTLGNAKAKVVIEVFGDFQCPWTRRFAPLVPQIAQAYPKKVKIIWRDFPLRFHKRAMPAAIAGREVFRQRGSKAFMKIARLMFTNARSLTDQNLVLWAGQAGANKAKVRAALLAGTYKSAILKEMVQAKTRGVRGTPTILVNGTPYKGRRTMAGFKATIDAL